MLKQYRSTNFRPDSQDRIDKVLEILGDYPDQKLSARQVYYQFVSRGWLENNVKNYKNLTGLLTDARYDGQVDWEVIEDRTREPQTPADWNSIGDVVESALASYRLPRWRGQLHYVELWVEKQALAGILWPIASKYHVTLMVNKGYSSASSMKESAERFMYNCGIDPDGDEDNEDIESLRIPILFYLGDHDPSGEDMVRDVEDRLVEFGVRSLEVRKLALTMTQIRQFKPPPNPAKVTDSRAKAYIKKYGDRSWELDALPPRELNRLLEISFREVIDMPKMEAIIAQEKKDKARLREAAKKVMEE